MTTQDLSPADYLKKILNAKVYEVAQETPLERAPLLSARLKNDIYFKREDLQQVFSFKLRGAYNKMAQLTSAQRAISFSYRASNRPSRR
mgnify:CR=1 FL=1